MYGVGLNRLYRLFNHNFSDRLSLTFDCDLIILLAEELGCPHGHLLAMRRRKKSVIYKRHQEDVK